MLISTISLPSISEKSLPRSLLLRASILVYIFLFFVFGADVLEYTNLSKGLFLSEGGGFDDGNNKLDVPFFFFFKKSIL